MMWESPTTLQRLLAGDELNRASPASVVTKAMIEEITIRGGLGADELVKAEASRDYPEVKRCGRVIDADTRLIVVDADLEKQIVERQPVRFKELLGGSVQLWATKIDKLGLAQLPGRAEIYSWGYEYDPDFLGYMAGVFRLQTFINEPGAWVV